MFYKQNVIRHMNCQGERGISPLVQYRHATVAIDILATIVIGTSNGGRPNRNPTIDVRGDGPTEALAPAGPSGVS